MPLAAVDGVTASEGRHVGAAYADWANGSVVHVSGDRVRRRSSLRSCYFSMGSRLDLSFSSRPSSSCDELGRGRYDLAAHDLDRLDLIDAHDPPEDGLDAHVREPAQTTEKLGDLGSVGADIKEVGRRLLDRVVVAARFGAQAPE